MKAEEFFYSKQQRERYKYAVELATKLKNLQEEGYWLFDDEDKYLRVEGEVFIREDFDADDWDVVSINLNDCSVVFVEISRWDDGRPFIDSKKSIKKALGRFSMVAPKDIKKVTF